MGANGELNLDRIAWADARAMLAADAVLVTANQRQADALLRYADKQAEAAGSKPAIEPWVRWQQRAFEELSVHNNIGTRLLEDVQAEWLWQQVIDNDRHSDSLLNRPACAQAARTAWQLVQDFGVGEYELQQYPSAETDAFIHWARQYAEQLDSLSAIDIHQVSRWLSERLEAGEWQPPAQVITYGFERWFPVQRALLQALIDAGCQVHELALPDAGERVSVVAAIDPEQELLHAAQWARRQLLQAAETHTEPARHSIAIVVPDLHLRRAAVENALINALHPDWDGLNQPALESRQLFDISAALMLADEPLVQLAFDWLSLLSGQAEFKVFSRILRSPWLDKSECLARSRLEVHLRGMGLGRFTVAEVMQLAGLNEAKWHSPAFQDQLRALLEARPVFNERQSAPVWIERVTELLVRLEWPLADEAGTAQPDTLLRRCWRQLLDQFTRLSPATEPIPGHISLNWLQRLARNVPVQQARPHAGVQVLGLLEAMGQRFDALWVTGMTAAQWPAAPRPNPLLPAALQRRHQMPQASAAQELAYAQHATKTLLSAAPEALFSYALTEQDAAQQPSPLVRSLAGIEKLPAISPQPLWQTMWEQQKLEPYADEQAPALVDLSDDVAAATGASHGGSGVLKAQAQCPFQALAAYRLNAEPLELLRPGISALQHGNCVHAVMQAFWQGFDPAHINDEPARVAHLSQCIEQVLAQNTIACLRQPRLREAYTSYLQVTLARWLAVEAQRPPGFAIDALEQGKPLAIGPLRLQVRMDRVDQLPDGSRVVLDYKSGVGHPKHWADERLSEPQLPLYAVHTDNLGGVAFANLHPQKTGFQGFTLDAGQLPDVPVLGSGRGGLHRAYPEWPALRQMWQQRLAELADGYFHGQARPDPASPQTCQYCRRYSLCRIAGMSADADASDRDGDE